MKKLILALLVLTSIACSKQECIELTLGNPTEIQNKDLICIDGTEYSFLATDARCACFTDCIWEGEFLLNFEDSNGTNVFSFHQIDTMANVSPPFSDSFILTDFSGHGECGDDSKIDDVTFVIQID